MIKQILIKESEALKKDIPLNPPPPHLGLLVKY